MLSLGASVRTLPIRRVLRVLEAASELNAHERNTLQLGSVLFLSTLGMGLQFARWPVWSALVILAGYLAWVIGYSEATVQVQRWRLSRPSPDLSQPAAQPQAAPVEEHRPT